MPLGPAQRILMKLDGRRVKRINSVSWQAPCPGHDDQHASLTVTEKPDRVLLHCHAGCDIERDVLPALGITWADLFTDNGKKGKRKIKEEYCYRDEDGKPLYFAVRFEPKDFRQYHLENGKKIWNLDGCRRVLYRLPELRQAIREEKTVHIVEGEKDVHTLVKLGLIATCNPMGAGNGKWLPEYTAQLKGARQVVILPDDDDPGREHAKNIAASLAGIVPDIRIVQVPAKDVSDWIQDGGTKIALLGLVEGTDPVVGSDRGGMNGTGEQSPVPASLPHGREDRVDQVEENLTDLGNARRLVRLHHEDLRYCHPWGKWLVWDGRRWKGDDTSEIERRAKDTIARMYAEASRSLDKNTRKGLASHAMKSESKAKLDAMISLAKSEPGIPILPDQCDTDPWLLTVLNGTLNLKGTGELHPHRQADYITKLCPAEFRPDAKAPTWASFLYRVMQGNEEMIRFLQRAVGYSLTGKTSERCLFVLHGTGKNGKSTFLEAVREMMGPDYAATTPTSTLLTKKGDAIPNDLARLAGIRLVSARETDEGRRLAEAMVKHMTGQDTLVARFLRAEFFEFRPEFKIWLGTNHLPVVRGSGEAIWDRIRLIPFNVRIPDSEQDGDLGEKLKTELPGILAWAVAGVEEWQNEGLAPPQEVTDATQGYREDMDVLAGFLDERCVTQPDATARAGELYKAYRSWCEAAGDRPISSKVFGLRLVERGFQKQHSRAGKVYHGIGLQADPSVTGDGS